MASIRSIEALAGADIVAISPHFDDVAFSCAHALGDACAKGKRVVVITLFSETGEESPLMLGSADQERRRAEDVRASEVAGFERLEGGFLDAPFREPSHSDFLSIVWEEPAPNELAAVSLWLGTMLANAQPKEVWAPLAVGRHVDHRIAYHACYDLQRALPDFPVFYYEDLPYAWADQAAEMRLSEMGFNACPDVEAFEKSFLSSLYVDAFLPHSDRDNCLKRYRRSIEFTETPGQEATPVVRNFYDIDSPWDIVSAYASQIPSFVGDRKSYTEACIAHASRIAASGPRGERFWDLHVPS